MHEEIRVVPPVVDPETSAGLSVEPPRFDQPGNQRIGIAAVVDHVGEHARADLAQVPVGVRLRHPLPEYLEHADRARSIAAYPVRQLDDLGVVNDPGFCHVASPNRSCS